MHYRNLGNSTSTCQMRGKLHFQTSKHRSITTPSRQNDGASAIYVYGDRKKSAHEAGQSKTRLIHFIHKTRYWYPWKAHVIPYRSVIESGTTKIVLSMHFEIKSTRPS